MVWVGLDLAFGLDVSFVFNGTFYSQKMQQVKGEKTDNYTTRV